MFGTLTVGVVTLGAVIAGVVTAGVLTLGTVTLGTVAAGPDGGPGILGGPVTGGGGVGVEGTGDDDRASAPPALALVPSRAVTSAVAGALAGGEPTAAGDRRALAGGSTPARTFGAAGCEPFGPPPACVCPTAPAEASPVVCSGCSRASEPADG